MNKETYLEILLNHRTWFKYAKTQKDVADKILHNCMLDQEFLLKMKKDNNFDPMIDLWSNAHYHYGIGIENGFKGLIVKYQKEKVKYTVSNDNVKLNSIGGKASMGHNLLKLAEVCGIFEMPLQLDKETLKSVLQNFTDMIKWASRYPVPISPDKIFEFDGSVPAVTVYGFHVLDVIEPLFELFEKENKD